eukprot:symbB.v1.2.008714.t1/scaffold547.1/size188680/6
MVAACLTFRGPTPQMNGSEKRDASSELEQLLQKCKKTFTDQDDLMRTLLQAVWWVKEELEKQDVTIKKHEAKLSEQDSRINALEKELAKPLPPIEAVEKVAVAQAAPPAVAVAPPVVVSRQPKQRPKEVLRHRPRTTWRLLISLVT